MPPDAAARLADSLGRAAVAAPRSDSLARAAVEAVFRQAAYARSTRESLTARFWRWLGGLLRRMFAGDGSRWSGGEVVTWLLILLALLVVARLVYAAITSAERASGRSRGAGRTREGAAGDPWAEARAHAAEGRYVEAAHALYRALLAGVADRERVRLHPSKTAGDYVRELRRLRSPMLTPFRDFARAYEVVAYGTGECDRARYERLLALAGATLDVRARAAA